MMALRKKGEKDRITFGTSMTVVTCFLQNFFIGGLNVIQGLLYTEMKVSLNVEEYPLTWIGSIQNGSFGLLSVLGTLCIHRIGGRKTTMLGALLVVLGLAISSQTRNLYLLYATIGLLPGVGLVLGYMSTLVCMTDQFKTYRSLTIGVCLAGVAIGNLVWPPITSMLMDAYSWQGALLIYGAVMLHMIPSTLSAANKASTSKETSRTSTDEKKASICTTFLSYIAIFKLPGTILFCIARFCTSFGIFTFPTFVPEHAVTSNPGITSLETALIITVFGIGNFAGRVIFSSMSLINQKAGLVIMTICLALNGVTHIVVPFCRDVISLEAIGFFIGLFTGGWATLDPILTVYLFGKTHLSKGLAAALTCQGLGTVAGPPVQSYIATIAVQRDLIFYIAAGCLMLSFLCHLPIPFKVKPVKPKDESCDVKSTSDKECYVVTIRDNNGPC